MTEKIAFILGKNSELSVEEIKSYLSSLNKKFDIISSEEEFLIVEAEDFDGIKIDDLGGTIKICKIENVVSDVEMNFDVEKFFDLSKKTITFGISTYNIENWKAVYQDFASYFKNELRKNKIKAGVVHLPDDKSCLTHVEVINRKLVENGEIVICFSNGDYYIGKTVQVHNPFEFQKRDVGRPEQRAIYSIPPRLAKIMINLLEIRKGVLLDPFCGIGTILQEALLMGFDIRGIDIDGKCIDSAKKNLEWLEKEYGVEIRDLDKKIISGDSRNLSKYFEKESVDGIVTEPYLGPPLAGIPTESEAENILNGLEKLYMDFLTEAHKILKPKGRICVVSPRIKIDGNRSADRFRHFRGFYLNLEMNKICKRTGFSPLKQLTDSEERHKIIREINLLEKS